MEESGRPSRHKEILITPIFLQKPSYTFYEKRFLVSSTLFLPLMNGKRFVINLIRRPKLFRYAVSTNSLIKWFNGHR